RDHRRGHRHRERRLVGGSRGRGLAGGVLGGRGGGVEPGHIRAGRGGHRRRRRASPLLVGQRGDHRLIRGGRGGQLGPERVPGGRGGRHRGGTGAAVHPRGVDLRGQCCVVHI